MHHSRRTLIAVCVSVAFALAPVVATYAASPAPAKGEHGTVSYTHLTLPTILRV